MASSELMRTARLAGAMPEARPTKVANPSANAMSQNGTMEIGPLPPDAPPIIWLSPLYLSPDADNGYDISDYCSIDPKYGTMADMERLIAEAQRLDLKLVMDLVINHTSDQHEYGRWWRIRRYFEQHHQRDLYDADHAEPGALVDPLPLAGPA